jgi:hypothetical protein
MVMSFHDLRSVVIGLFREAEMKKGGIGCRP